MEKDIPLKQTEKKGGIAISEKIDFKTKSITKDKAEHYILIKRSIQEEDMIVLNIYAPNIGAPKYIKQILTDIKGEIESNAIIIIDFNTHLHPWIDHQDRKSIEINGFK